MIEEKPAILSYKHWDEKVSVELESSGLHISEFYELCRKLALASGYQPETVEEYFGESQ